MDKKEILVLGAGVSGLSCGILLLRQGYKVTIWAKDLSPNTTSDKAAAHWYPYLSEPKDKVTRLAKFTLEYLKNNFIADPKSGCMIRKTTEIFTHQAADPWWKEATHNFRRLPSKDLPEGYTDGYQFDGILSDTSIYMNYLVEMLQDLGGNIVQKTISNIDQALNKFDIIVNCTGLASRELFNDNLLYPVRAQVIKIKPNGFDEVIVDDEGPNGLCYIIHRINDIVLGGTHQKNDWNLEVDPKDTEDILRKAGNINPQFKNVEIISEVVGLRPVRDEIRVEIEKFGDKTVVHNYGHGGSGFTLSWGCAQEVVTLVNSLGSR